MAPSSIDQEQIWEKLSLCFQSTETATDHFSERTIIVDTLHALNLVATISRLERKPIDELHHAGHRIGSTEVRNIDAFYEAFGVGEDDALYLDPQQRVRIWN